MDDQEKQGDSVKRRHLVSSLGLFFTCLTCVLLLLFAATGKCCLLDEDFLKYGFSITSANGDTEQGQDSWIAPPLNGGLETQDNESAGSGEGESGLEDGRADDGVDFQSGDGLNLPIVPNRTSDTFLMSRETAMATLHSTGDSELSLAQNTDVDGSGSSQETYSGEMSDVLFEGSNEIHVPYSDELFGYSGKIDLSNYVLSETQFGEDDSYHMRQNFGDAHDETEDIPDGETQEIRDFDSITRQNVAVPFVPDFMNLKKSHVVETEEPSHVNDVSGLNEIFDSSTSMPVKYSPPLLDARNRESTPAMNPWLQTLEALDEDVDHVRPSVAPTSTNAWTTAFPSIPEIIASLVTEKPFFIKSHQVVCTPITSSECGMLPYAETIMAALPPVDLRLLITFFQDLQQLGCYRHMLSFGCAVVHPQCLPQSLPVLPCMSYCDAARSSCERAFTQVGLGWPEFLSCSHFHNDSSVAGAADEHNACLAAPQEVSEEVGPCLAQGGFWCSSTLCISKKLVCNGYNDCGDWSDEKLCSCGAREFRCGTGRCVSLSQRCDGFNDCGDLSDETACHCDNAVWFRCGDGVCVSRAWVCDGDADCSDRSDELNCTCKSHGMQECDGGLCIPPSYLCDGERDCEDGRDEEGCGPGEPLVLLLTYTNQFTTASVSPTCHAHFSVSSYFSDLCEPITLEWCLNQPYNATGFPNALGHGTQAAAAASWEAELLQALTHTACHPHMTFLSCALLLPKCKPNSSHKILPCRSLCEEVRGSCERHLLAVGLSWPPEAECGRLSQWGPPDACLLPDANNADARCSPLLHFRCASGHCVSAARRCDSRSDCDDASDEQDCECAQRGMWECFSDKSCINLDMHCDGFPDCRDEEDEKFCSQCEVEEVACLNHQCVPQRAWCDGERHCADGSDEWDCVGMSDHNAEVTPGPRSALLVHRHAQSRGVCADGWSVALSHLACAQMGFWGEADTHFLQRAVRKKFLPPLHLTPGWHQTNTSTVQAALAEGIPCDSESIVSVICHRNDCGRRSTSSPRRMSKRILGGRASREGRWPWQGSLRTALRPHSCGCTLIHRRWALTGAHCFTRQHDPEAWTAVFGVNNLGHLSAFRQERKVRRIIRHERFSARTLDYDVALVELREEVWESPHVQPACLPHRGVGVPDDTYCVITGWGVTSAKVVPSKLQEGEVRIISPSACQGFFPLRPLTPRMLCAGYEAGSVDSCMGDSGGPLVCEETDRRWTLYGLTSWGSVCSSKSVGPGVYTNVTQLLGWIERHIFLHTFF
ncbi:unnamed protein product [Lampetra planeri]